MTGWKTWAALEEVTAANMNSYVRDQTIQVFTNSATRNAAITAPTKGLVSYLTDSGTIETYYGATTGWKPPWALPWGLVASGSSSTNSANLTTSFATTNVVSSSFTKYVGRTYKIEVSALMLALSASLQTTEFRVVSSAGPTATLTNISISGTAYYTVSGFVYVTPLSSASETWTLQAKAAGGGGTAAIVNATVAGKILVHDIGPETIGSAPAS